MGGDKARTELFKIAQARLYPSLTSHSFLVLRRRRLIFSEWIKALPGENLTVLDVGGRYQPYRPLLAGRSTRYVAVDVLQTPLVDVVGKGQELPFRDETFDLVIATGVFEYFPEPRVAAEQIRRVLKPGGCLIMSVAAICPRAVDEEHWHYLPAGLRFALASFSQVEIVPEVTSLGGFFRLAAWSFDIFAKYNFVRRIVQHTLIPALNLSGLALEWAGVSDNDQVTGNYSVLARN
jgi:SAM-dependent methyltransferase